MYSYRHRNQNRQRSRDPLERRMDQWIETGRQFVDGVAGNRPGQRRTARPIGSSLNNVGRWVGDKIDWFLEDEDDWVASWELEQDQKESFPSRKRPLEAISLRGRKSLNPASSPDRNIVEDSDDSWPDDSAFRVDRWERQEVRDYETTPKPSRENSDLERPLRRPLPRSSRRRN